MGKAMAVQTAKNRATGSVRAFSSHSKTGKAKIHTSSNKEARAVERPLFEGRDNGMFNLLLISSVYQANGLYLTLTP